MQEQAIKVRFIEIDNEHSGQRLDNFLLGALKQLPKSRIYTLIRKGEVRVNKKRAKPGQRLDVGDIVRIPPVRITEREKPVISTRLTDSLLNNIVFQDENFIAIDKPHGLAVHGGSGLSFGVIEGLRQALTNPKLELVHRLDRETSGCLLIAKHRQALLLAHEALRLKQAKKRYLALLYKPWEGPKQKIIDVPLLKNTLSGGERVVSVDDNGKPSHTMFKLLKNYKDTCLVYAYPVTGRTHQIRVHAQHMGHAIVGDPKYKDKESMVGFKVKPPRLFLHANQLSFKGKLADYFFEAKVNQEWQDWIDISVL